MHLVKQWEARVGTARLTLGISVLATLDICDCEGQTLR